MPDAPQFVQSLYVHVPFCVRKCAYCAFHSEASNGPLIDRYIGALIREMELVAPELEPRTVFFGGGTPSLLSLRQWERIFDATRRLHLDGALEWTVECNPATVSLDKARLLREGGVNRVSLGVQSLDHAALECLGRIHTREMVFESFDLLRRAGFDNINVDLMFGIPGQGMGAWRATLDEVLAMGSEHMACYEVIYEEDTPLFERLRAGEFKRDEDLACAMYEEMVQRAGGAGFEQYEVANFARCQRVPASGQPEPASPGVAGAGRDLDRGDGRPAIPRFACRHNVNYWRGGSFHGLGPSATGYVRGVRAKNVSDTRLYCDQLEKGCRAIESREELPSLARAGETAAFGLRMVDGWGFDEFTERTGYDLRVEWMEEMRRLTDQGWGWTGADRFRLTPEGLRFADAAARLFLR